MKVSLPGDEFLFEAADGGSYVTILSRENPRPNLSLFSVIQELMAANTKYSRLSHLSAFPLFSVVMCKYVYATAI